MLREQQRLSQAPKQLADGFRLADMHLPDLSGDVHGRIPGNHPTGHFLVEPALRELGDSIAHK